MTPLQKAILDVLNLPGVDYVGPDALTRYDDRALPVNIAVPLWESIKNRDNYRKKAINRIQRALSSLVKQGLVDHPARGKYAANPRSVADFMATLKPWDCVKVKGEWWMVAVNRPGFLCLACPTTGQEWKSMEGGNNWHVHLHEIDTADVRNVKPGRE